MISGGRVTAAYETVQGVYCFTLRLEVAINNEPAHIKVAVSADTDAAGVEMLFDALWQALKQENYRFN